MRSEHKTADISLAAVLLAAGRSKRMGRPKMLLPWRQTSVIGHLLRQWRELKAARIVVVCAEGDQALASELDRLNFPIQDRIYNPTPDQGMFSSIRCAAKWTGWETASVGKGNIPPLQLTHWAIVLGDQPHLRHETLQALLEFTTAHPESICFPRSGGHRRHPVFLPRRFWLQLAESSARDLKKFLDSHAEQTAICDLPDAGLELDIDYREDYKRAREISD
jgi:molybdenum cofactor cytidylyltransferase